MKRTTKRYTISTGAVNNYGYRVSSKGVDFTQYNRNPILTWMHTRADNNDRNQILPLGRVVEIRLDGDAWTGQLEFDETDSFAMAVYNKYEVGILNMLSLAAIPIEVSDEAQFMLPRQTNPTVLSCKVNHISAVDVGGNDQALPVQLYDANGITIALSQGSISSFLQLAKGSKKELFSTINHKKTTVDVVNNAVNAGKLTETMAHALLSGGHDDKSVSDIMAHVKGAKISPDRLEGKIPKAAMHLVTKNWYELKNSAGDGTRILKEFAPEVCKAKHFEEYGRLPAERTGSPCKDGL